MAQNGLLDLQEMKPTPRNQLLGLLADALTAGRDFADKAKVPAAVPMLGGQGLGSLLLGKAPEEVNEISYGNLPLRINPLAGRTASFVPEIKPGRKEQVADLVMALQGVPGGNRAALAGLGAVDTGVGKAAIVYHGSPHKFDRFDASKIGTGEGAQAYGHGLYLAESPAVAAGYRDKLTPAAGWGYDGMAANSLDKATRSAATQLSMEMRGIGTPSGWPDVETAKQMAIRKLIKQGDQDAAKAITGLDPSKIGDIEGSLYKVDLPDNKIAQMLDWDKPLSQQASALDSLSQNKNFAQYVERIMERPLSALDGKTLQRMAVGYAADMGTGGASGAAGLLKNAGIPGIRYLDGGSRGVGAGTSNFVVFPGEENALRILGRNGGLLAP